jgi:hypothetical protein
MTEFGDLFAFSLSASTFVMGSMIMLAIFGGVVAWMTGEPTQGHALDAEPAYGL